MVDVQALKNTRSGHRAVATRRIKETDDLCAASSDPDPVRLDQLKRGLTDTLGSLNKVQDELLTKLDPGDLENDIDESEQVKDRLFAALAKIDRALSKTTVPATAAPVLGPPPVSAPPTPTAKLPKLSLKNFNGSLIGWSPFWDSYKTAVHDNASLSNVQKYTYLQSLLEGRAKDAIAGLPITEANYDVAVNLLQDRFGDKEKMIDAHMDKLMKIEPVRSDTHVTELRRLYDRTESTVRSLEALGVSLDSYGALLTPVFVPKLPNELRLTIARKVPKSEWNMRKILEVLQEELEARERAGIHYSKPNGHQGFRRNRDQPTMGTFSNNSEGGCSFCGEDGHQPINCKNVVSIEERRKLIRGKGLCFNCLRKGHLGRDCKSSASCNNCRGRHHTSICSKVKPERSRNSEGSHNGQKGLNPSSPSFKPSEPTTTCYSNNNDTILLQTAETAVFNIERPAKSISAHILLDCGSQCSYISRKACKRLELRPIGHKAISIMTFGSRREQHTKCGIVKLGMKLKGGGTLEVKLLSVDHICEPINIPPFDVDQYPHLKNLAISSPANQFVPDILLGSDQYWSLLTGEVIRGEQGPVALNSHVGWILSGPAATKKTGPQQTTLVTHVLRVDGHVESKNLDRTLQSFWNVEAIGIIEDERVVQKQFESHVSFENGRYVVSLPWKESEIALADNYRLCLRRLLGLFRRLRDSPDLLEKYNHVMQEQLALGIVVPVNTQYECKNRIHYLPHHAVIRKDKCTTKVRVVYDASAKTEGPSLNDCLHVGPSLHLKMLDLLLRFRIYPIAVIADLEKAFLMVRVADADQDVLRFLWYKDIHAEVPEVEVYKFTRVVFGVSPSPYLLNATIAQHLTRFENSHASTVEKLRNSMYVDDVISGADSVEEAFKLCNEAKSIFHLGGFNLRKFNSNDKALNILTRDLESADGNSLMEESYARSTLGSANRVSSGECKVLGVKWDTNSDELVIDIEPVVTEARSIEPTKRNIVSIVSKLYDPMGFISPVIIPLKIYFKELCQSKISWDEPLTESLRNKWRHLLNGLQMEGVLRIPRCCVTQSKARIKLIGFCDASLKAYGAVVYSQEEAQQCKILVSKTRVAPSPNQTIPRLELLGALLLARIVKHLKDALSDMVEGYECYTDSIVVLHWIKGTSKMWKPYVQNRVTEIRANVESEFWAHCQGKDNPADLPSRGQTLLELSESCTWFCGPPWLREREREKELGLHDSNQVLPPDCLRELRVTKSSTSVRREPMLENRKGGTLLPPDKMEEFPLEKNVLEEREEGALLPPVELEEFPLETETKVFNVTAEGSEGRISEVIHVERFSSLDKLITCTGYVLAFVSKLKQAIGRGSDKILESYKHDAEAMWIREVQRGRIKAEWKSQFSLTLDERKIWRCGGRLQNAELSRDACHPILLPKEHPYTTLVVRKAHQRVRHSGTKDTLTELRSHYWIPRGRSLVQTIIHKCVLCRRFGARSYRPPPPPPLPEYRVKEGAPFSSVGVDYAGPLVIKQYAHTSNRGTPNAHISYSGKAWVCLFTCCTSRAVHFEIVTDLSSQSFIRCLKRFVSRRGLPSLIISDNGSTFKSAAKEIRKLMNHPLVKEYLATVEIRWIFNIERAPWWGGFFERMVQLLKRCLRKMVGQAKLTYDELYTAVTEVESILNSRPLTYIEATDLEEPLTPSHLIIGKRLLSLPDHMCPIEADPDYTTTRVILNKRAQYLQTVLKNFWCRWKREYLLELRESHRRKEPKNISEVRVGDVVIIHDDTPRGVWRMGVIEEKLTGKDGGTRGAVVRVRSGQGSSAFLKRPIQKLYPLEVCQPERSSISNRNKQRTPETVMERSIEESSANVETLPIEPSNIVEANVLTRPKRQAAVEARDRIVASCMD